MGRLGQRTRPRLGHIRDRFAQVGREQSNLGPRLGSWTKPDRIRPPLTQRRTHLGRKFDRSWPEFHQNWPEIVHRVAGTLGRRCLYRGGFDFDLGMGVGVRFQVGVVVRHRRRRSACAPPRCRRRWRSRRRRRRQCLCGRRLEWRCRQWRRSPIHCFALASRQLTY